MNGHTIAAHDIELCFLFLVAPGRPGLFTFSGGIL